MHDDWTNLTPEQRALLSGFWRAPKSVIRSWDGKNVQDVIFYTSSRYAPAAGKLAATKEVRASLSIGSPDCGAPAAETATGFHGSIHGWGKRRLPSLSAFQWRLAGVP